MLGVSKETTAQAVMQYFGNGAGEVIFIPFFAFTFYENREFHFCQVKYFRWCTKDGVEAEKDEETNGRYFIIWHFR